MHPRWEISINLVVLEVNQVTSSIVLDQGFTLKCPAKKNVWSYSSTLHSCERLKKLAVKVSSWVDVCWLVVLLDHDPVPQLQSPFFLWTWQKEIILQSSFCGEQCKQGCDKWQPWVAMPRPPSHHHPVVFHGMLVKCPHFDTQSHSHTPLHLSTEPWSTACTHSNWMRYTWAISSILVYAEQKSLQ